VVGRPTDPPSIKENLHINVELAYPLDFIPVPDGWEDRSPFIRQEGRAFFYHFDLYAQALAKIERGHAQDLTDVQEMLRRGLMTPPEDWNTLPLSSPSCTATHPIDPRALHAAVTDAFRRS